MSTPQIPAQTTKPPFTHEASRYCHGDDGWTKWQPCTEAQAEEYRKDSSFKVRPLEKKTK